MDSEGTAAIERALERAPEDTELRTYLVRLLLGEGRQVEALNHSRHLLAIAPDNLSSLELAATAADACGLTEQSTAYRRIVTALQAQTPSETTPARNTAITDVDELISSVFETETPQLTLGDVAGLENVKLKLQQSFFAPMRNAELTALYGASARGGMLLWGPPGCGKTFLAKAIAGELGAHFISVGIHEILDMWVGGSEKNVHELFKRARAKTPCVLFFDELDAIGMTRGSTGSNSSSGVVTQLLNELDGVKTNNDGIFVLGATNVLWKVDSALRRPGRFDHTLLVLPPDPAAREAILRHHLKDLLVDDLDLTALVRDTEGFSGADLALVCRAAGAIAMDRALKSGLSSPITELDLRAARADISPSTLPWFRTANNFALFANKSGEYDELIHYIKKRKLA